MSQNLYWRPIRDGESVGNFVLRNLLEDRKRVWDKTDIPYLSGLRDGKVEGAQELIDAIEKHEEIELYVE